MEFPMTDTPQLYLMTPAGAQASALGPLLIEVMDRFPPACLRIRAGAEEDELGRLADLARLGGRRDPGRVADKRIG
jgi:thiamine-phosphate pyrophosphorylase